MTQYNIEDVGDVMKMLKRAREHAHRAKDDKLTDALDMLLDPEAYRTETVTVRLSARTKRIACIIAKAQSRTLSGYIAHCVKDNIDKVNE